MQSKGIPLAGLVLLLACALFGMSYGWPVWLCAVVFVVAALSAGFLWWRGSRTTAAPVAPPPVPQQPRPVEPQASPPERRDVTDVLLPSSCTGYSFTFSCVVRWAGADGRPDGEIQPNPGALAVEAVVAAAERLCAELQPAEADRGTYRLEAELGLLRRDGTGRLGVWAESVSLRLSERDRTRVEALENVRKDEDVFDRECTFERKVRAYLGDDVLSSSGSAAVWWLARPDTAEKERVGATVKKLDELRRLADFANGVDNQDGDGMHNGATGPGDAFANGQGVLPLMPEAPPPEPTVDEHAAAIVDHVADPDERALLGKHLTQLLRSHSGEDVARNLEVRIGTAGSAGPADSVDPVDPADVANPVDAVDPADADTPAESESWFTDGEDAGRLT